MNGLRVILLTLNSWSSIYVEVRGGICEYIQIWVLSFHSGVLEDSGLPGYDDVSQYLCFPKVSIDLLPLHVISGIRREVGWNC